MTESKVVIVTEVPKSQAHWEGYKGKDRFKTKGYYVALTFFLIGLVAIIIIGILIGTNTIGGTGSPQDQTADPTTRAKQPQPPTQRASTTRATQPSAQPAPTTRAPQSQPTTQQPQATETPAPQPPTQSEEELILARLREAVGSDDQVFVSNFSNWDGTTFVAKVYRVVPYSVREIQDLILAAHDLDLKIRPFGSGMSYSNLFSDQEQIQLDGSSLKTKEDGESFTYNEAASTVSAAPGQTIATLVEFLVANDIQVMSLPGPQEATLGGAVSTATHSKNPYEGTISDQVLEIKYVDGEGHVQQANTSQPGDLERIRCCVGLCGIIYEITFHVEPMTIVDIVQGFESGQTMFRNSTYLRGMIEDHWGLDFHYAPLSSLSEAEWTACGTPGGSLPESLDLWQDLWWYRVFRPSADQDGSRRRKRQAGEEGVPPLESGHVGDVNNGTDTAPPEMANCADLLLHKYAYNYTAEMVEAQPVVTESYPRAMTSVKAADLDKTLSMLYVIPETPSYTVLEKAMELLFGQLQSYTARNKMPILTVSLRWLSKSDKCTLCPGAFPETNNTHTLNLEIISAFYKADFYQFSAEMLELYKTEWPDLRLGWAKFYDSVAGVTDFLYESSMEAFDPLLKPENGDNNVQVWDVFMSDLLYQVVYNKTAKPDP